MNAAWLSAPQPPYNSDTWQTGGSEIPDLGICHAGGNFVGRAPSLSLSFARSVGHSNVKMERGTERRMEGRKKDRRTNFEDVPPPPPLRPSRNGLSPRIFPSHNAEEKEYGTIFGLHPNDRGRGRPRPEDGDTAHPRFLPIRLPSCSRMPSERASERG